MFGNYIVRNYNITPIPFGGENTITLQLKDYNFKKNMYLSSKNREVGFYQQSLKKSNVLQVYN